jgi:hypothetical protein
MNMTMCAIRNERGHLHGQEIKTQPLHITWHDHELSLRDINMKVQRRHGKAICHNTEWNLRCPRPEF